MTVRAWMDDGTKHFLDTLNAIGDSDLVRPTALPGWTGRTWSPTSTTTP